MSNVFGTASRKHLEGVHPDLVRLHEAVLAVFDHSITDGSRTRAEQEKNVARGVSKTMDSKHLPQADGKAHATDAVPFPAPNWTNVERALAAVKRVDPTFDLLRFYYFQGVMRGVASQLGVPIRQGINWDGDKDFADSSFIDLPHNELVKP